MKRQRSKSTGTRSAGKQQPPTDNGTVTDPSATPPVSKSAARAMAWLAARAFCIVSAILLAFVLLWPVFSEPYSRAFVGVSHTLFHSLGSNVRVDFSRIEERGGRDISMKVHNRQTRMMVERHIPSRYAGYLPAALLLALTIATPLSWRRRVIALAIGMVTLHVYIALVLLLTITRILSRDGPAQLFTLPGVLDMLLEHTIYQTTTAPTFSMLVPVVIWAAATFRRGDFVRIVSDQKANTQG
jgi:hypothetical protein